MDDAIENRCREPGCSRPVRCRDRCTYHYRRWLQSQDRIGKLQTCRHCAGEFRAPDARKFCSLECYLASDLRKQHDRERSDRVTKAEMKLCTVCKTPMPVPPCLARRGKRFCSQACYRIYLAERFDRWVANPKTISDLQGFDEFLSRTELPCLIEGCAWRGKLLAQHVNRKHGVTADQFKAMVGFNKGTGLVTPAVQRLLTAAALKNRKTGKLKNGPTGTNRGRKGEPLRKEHLEHLKKSIALRREDAPPRS